MSLCLEAKRFPTAPVATCEACRPLEAPTPPCYPTNLASRRNLIALGFLVKFQKHLSLRVLVLQPLVITFIMLLSTAALVRINNARRASKGSGAGMDVCYR